MYPIVYLTETSYHVPSSSFFFSVSQPSGVTKNIMIIEPIRSFIFISIYDVVLFKKYFLKVVYTYSDVK